MKKKKIKEIKLPVKFNPGLQKYEPELPTRKTGEKTKVKIKWVELIFFIIGIIILMTIFFIVLKNRIL